MNLNAPSTRGLSSTSQRPPLIPYLSPDDAKGYSIFVHVRPAGTGICCSGVATAGKSLIFHQAAHGTVFAAIAGVFRSRARFQLEYVRGRQRRVEKMGD